jgi:MFS family permease
LAIIALTIGCVVFGRLCDAIGSARTFLLGSAALAITVTLFYHGLQSGTESMVLNYVLAGFCVGIVGAVPYVMVNAFPAAVRFTGLSFSYNVAYAIFGGLTPMLVTLWMKEDVLAPSHYVTAVCAVGFVVGLALLMLNRRSAQTAASPA